MGLDDLKNKASEALNSDKGEEISDQGLDKASEFAKEKSGGKFDDKIDSARDAADGKLGNA